MTNQIDRAILAVLGDGDQYKLLEICRLDPSQSL